MYHSTAFHDEPCVGCGNMCNDNEQYYCNYCGKGPYCFECHTRCEDVCLNEPKSEDEE